MLPIFTPLSNKSITNVSLDESYLSSSIPSLVPSHVVTSTMPSSFPFPIVESSAQIPTMLESGVMLDSSPSLEYILISVNHESIVFSNHLL